MKRSTRNEPILLIPKAKIAIIQANWYRDYTDRMVAKFIETITPADPASTDRYLVPGALEIPLAARRVLRLGKDYEAVVVFAVIIKGDTYHFDTITRECTRALTQVMLQEDVPIINHVIPADSLDLIEERSQDNEDNKGYEAAFTTSELIVWRRTHPEVNRLD